MLCRCNHLQEANSRFNVFFLWTLHYDCTSANELKAVSYKYSTVIEDICEWRFVV